MREALPKMDNAGGFVSYGKGTCQVCGHRVTTNNFTTRACGEVFKIQSGPLNCNLDKVIYFLRYKICDGPPYVGKNNFGLIIIKVKPIFSKIKQNVPQKCFHSYYVQDFHKDIGDWEVTLFENCETQKQLKGSETYWLHKLKTFIHLA